MVAVPRGNRMAVLTYASRANFGGPMQVYAKDLPKGMTLECDVMADNVDAVPVVLNAAADAPVAGGLIDLRAKHIDPKVNIDGGMKLQADLVYVQNVGSYIALRYRPGRDGCHAGSAVQGYAGRTEGSTGTERGDEPEGESRTQQGFQAAGQCLHALEPARHRFGQRRHHSRR